MPLHARQPAHGADEERAGAETQLPPDFLANPRRPHLAQVHAVVNLNDRRRPVPGIPEGFGHALRDRDDAVRETPECRLVERVIRPGLCPLPASRRLPQAVHRSYHVGHTRQFRRDASQDIVFVPMRVDDLDVAIA